MEQVLNELERQLLVQKYPTVQSGLDFFALILPSACPCNQLFSRFSFSGMLYTLIRIETDVLSKVQTKEVPSPNQHDYKKVLS